MDEFDDDTLLVAYLDGELNAQAISELEERLLGDADLALRLEHLRASGATLGPAFAALLNNAPTERLQASLGNILAAEAARPAQEQHRRMWMGWARAAAAACLVLVGVGVGRFAPIWPELSPQTAVLSPEQREDWRHSVAEYVALYTPDTFADLPTDAAIQTAEMTKLGAKLGISLTPERIAVADLQYRGALILKYDGSSLGQLAYVDAHGEPVLFCIVTREQPDAPLRQEKRGDFASASWAHDGRGYMVIGHLPAEQLAELAVTLKLRF